MKYFTLLRVPNLLMLAAMQAAFRYGFYERQGVIGALFNYQFILLILATVCLAAAGYVVNDIHDQATDRINKPGRNQIGASISESAAWRLYVTLNIIGVSCGFFLAHAVGRPWFTLIFMVVVLVLYQYAAGLKRTLLVGNLTVAFLAFLSVMILGIFDLFPVLTDGNRGFLGIIFGILIDFGVFAFIINLMREVVKDLEDVDGDYNQGMNTLPIALGVKRTTRLLFWFSILPAALVLYYTWEYFFKSELYIVVGYSIICVAAPLIYCLVRLWDAKNRKDYKELSLVLKLVILAGIVALPLISYNIFINA